MVSQELGVHSSGRNVLGTLLLLDAVGVSLVRVVVRTGVLLLLGSKERKSRGGNKGGEMIYIYIFIRQTCSVERHSTVVHVGMVSSRDVPPLHPAPKRPHSSPS